MKSRWASAAQSVLRPDSGSAMPAAIRSSVSWRPVMAPHFTGLLHTGRMPHGSVTRLKLRIKLLAALKAGTMLPSPVSAGT